MLLKLCSVHGLHVTNPTAREWSNTKLNDRQIRICSSADGLRQNAGIFCSILFTMPLVSTDLIAPKDTYRILGKAPPFPSHSGERHSSSLSLNREFGTTVSHELVPVPTTVQRKYSRNYMQTQHPSLVFQIKNMTVPKHYLGHKPVST
jgi:hypothetical protein